jgi:hypothetical protein
MLFCRLRINRLWELKRRLHFVTVEIDLEEQMRLAPTELTFDPKFRRVLLGEVLPRRVPDSAFWRYHVSLQRKKCRQQIIGLNDESFSVAVCIDAKNKPALGEMLGDAVRPALCV